MRWVDATVNACVKRNVDKGDFRMHCWWNHLNARSKNSEQPILPKLILLFGIAAYASNKTTFLQATVYEIVDSYLYSKCKGHRAR